MTDISLSPPGALAPPQSLRERFIRWRDRGNWIGLILPLAILALWQTATARLKRIQPVFLPSPLATVEAFWTTQG